MVDAPQSIPLATLGQLYGTRFERLGEPEDINKAIECQSRALLLVPDIDEIELPLLGNLGKSYFDRFQCYRNVEDAEESIKCHMRFLERTPINHPNRITGFHNLAVSYLCRFECNGNVADINDAIGYQMQALELTPDDDARRPGMVNILGGLHLRRFERHGDLADIDFAIKYGIEALRFTPSGHPLRIAALSTLGGAYMRRYIRQEDIADGDNSVKYYLEAVWLIPDGHPSKPDMLSHLGNSYRFRFVFNGDVTDINSSIKYGLKAVELTPDSDADKAAWLTNLGSSYNIRFGLHGDVADIDNGIKCHLQVVRLTPESHPQKPGRLSNLGKAYMSRFKHYGDIEDINKAIECYTHVVELTPHDHADKPGWLFQLGYSHWSRFNRYTWVPDIVAAVAFVKQAAQCTTADPKIRFDAACKWAQFSPSVGASPQPAYQRAMELVPQLAWLGITIRQRYDLLLKFGNVAVEAASWAIGNKVFDCALEWLEQGRSVVWNQILQLRSPFDDLHAVKPELANNLKQVALALERAGSQSVSSLPANNASDLENDAQQHRRLAAEWDQLLEQARAVPGFESFMRPRTAAELMRAAKDGPVIVINAHETRCDALIIQPHSDHIAHVPLGSLSPEIALNFRVKLMSLIGHRNGRDRGFLRAMPRDEQDQFKAVLGSLWSDVVKPVLDFLGYKRGLSAEELPHVTWCCTGPLSFLPLHAAGCYDGSQPNAPDLVVSSYTPTLSALLAHSHSPPIHSSSILSVGQEYTKGHSDLPCTTQELAAIKEHVSDTLGYLQLGAEKATVDAVLGAMKEYSCVHLACHASQHGGDPTQSAFHLHDGDLTLETILQRSFENKGLAFLSACQTATGDEKLPDEAVHLAAGMLMAGYPSVVATMWSIQDEDAPEVARQVYANLVEDGRIDHTKAARALHKAVMGLRERVGEGSFGRWLPFIHMGL